MIASIVATIPARSNKYPKRENMETKPMIIFLISSSRNIFLAFENANCLILASIESSLERDIVASLYIFFAGKEDAIHASNDMASEKTKQMIQKEYHEAIVTAIPTIDTIMVTNTSIL